MRQRNQIEVAAIFLHGKAATDDIFQFPERNELRDGKIADRNDEMRPQDFELVVHP